MTSEIILIINKQVKVSQQHAALGTTLSVWLTLAERKPVLGSEAKLSSWKPHKLQPELFVCLSADTKLNPVSCNIVL